MLDVSWTEPNNLNMFLPDTASIVKERDDNFEPYDLQVSVNINYFH